MRSETIDQRTIDRALEGDKEAFGMLVRANGSRSLIVAERILRSPEDAISAARKFFVFTYTNLKKLRDLGIPELWLMQNLVRVCGDVLKEATKKGVAPPPCEFPKDLAEAGLLDTIGALRVAGGTSGALTAAKAAADTTSYADASAKADSRARAAQLVAKRREAVRRAIDCLPFLERTAVIFRDWDGTSYLEVAEILRVKQDDMRKLLTRGRKGVAEMLTPPGGFGQEALGGSESRTSLTAAAETPSSPGLPADSGAEGTAQLRQADSRGVAVSADAGVQTAPLDRKAARELSRRRAECKKLHDKIWLVAGGELGPSEIVSIMAHVRQCPECANLLRTASAVVEAIRDAATLEDKPLIAPEMLWREVEPLLVK
ncbi:MAG: zf-HC2 domain-containing protein [Candidatus Eisenbacteria bacterium]|nr:zf-HC2 domain-containing protein [Candidatus Eisenbacteria bacterium]